MRLHIIFDAYYMYYRYKYLIEAGKMRQLSTRLSEDKLENYNKFRAEYGLDPVAEDMDTTYIYYPIVQHLNFDKEMLYLEFVCMLD